MQVDTVIIGAGAAGLMCAGEARGRTLVIDHARKAGEKIRISGGGRCNFTNMGVTPECFLSRNPHFARSALARYTQWNFVDWVARSGIAYHEKTLGQLFCDGKSQGIIDMLRAACDAAGAEIWLETSVKDLRASAVGFDLDCTRDGETIRVEARHVVIATGGKSIPKMGATDFGYRVAEQFGLPTVDIRPALVPLTFGDRFADISGVSVMGAASAGGTRFEEACLFTHRGLSGPAVLQASSYWREGEAIELQLVASESVSAHMKHARRTQGKRAVHTVLAQILPDRLVGFLASELPHCNAADLSDKRIDALANWLSAWTLTPTGSEGYRTAEVTAGGVDTDYLSSKTMAAKDHPNLYFIGEVVDVTGWLGGYNFQWAWSSGWAAAQDINGKIG